MSSTYNPAASQGWIKAEDPKTGRVYYANTVTRKTQWDAPDGWVDESTPPPFPEEDDEDEPLPANWEVMHDPTTGKPFYVDHVNQKTQWTRPKPERKQSPAISFAPASTTASSARVLQASDFRNFVQPRSYSQEASYFQPVHTGSMEVDLSDSMPALDFSVKKVADKYRLECADCQALFTLSKRRHHCRLCGDVFCDACSSHRVLLPLEGPEFEKPVRICNFCNKDVDQGNYFSMRRYLTPLTLFDPKTDDEDEEGGVANAANVNAALSGLASDLDQLVQNAEGFQEKVTIPPDVLVPNIIKHLSSRFPTSDRAVRAIASLLSLGAMMGKQKFAHAVYIHGGRKTLDQILGLLERSGSDRKTLFVQEKAAQSIFYLTDPQTLTSLANAPNRKDAEDEDPMDALDIQRCLRNMLDHTSSQSNPNLQRWAAATVRNLVLEDQRRAGMAINEVAALVASGEPPSSPSYTSFLDQLISTGGIMILCSLVGSDDADTRAHATSALGAALGAIRAIDEANIALYEMTAGVVGRLDKKDGDIVRAITAGGGVGSSVSQLLLSADNSVATMGCDFVASLVRPLLLEPEGSETLSSRYDWRNDQSGLGACREAALEIACGSCLPSLLSIVRDNGRATRPMNLRCTAMETLASTALAVGEIGKAWASGKYEEGMDHNGAPALLTRAVAAFSAENVVEVMLEVLKASSLQSLGSSNDTPAARIREAAGIVLGSLASCSAEVIIELNSAQALSPLFSASMDPSMAAPSSMRGDSAPRCLGMLEAASAILMFSWRHSSGAASTLLDQLLEALDAGAITHLFRTLTFKVEWDSKSKSAGGMKARSAACRFVCCLFGIALTDETSIGMRRLMDACDDDQRSRRSTNNGPRNVLEAVLTALQTSLTQAHKMLVGGGGGLHQAALLELVETSLMATGSMCGSSVAPGGSDGVMIKGDQFLAVRADGFEARRQEVCRAACSVVVRSGRSGPSLLPTMLVGGFGEGTVGASLRVALAIAQNGQESEHTKLASSGLLVPIADILKSALSNGDMYQFSAALALVRFCGPFVVAGSSGGVDSVRQAIRIATNVLTLPSNPGASQEETEKQESLKSECIAALESLSKNAALWNAISTDALPSIVGYLDSSVGGQSLSRSAALRAVLQIVQVPSHAEAAAKIGLSVPLGKILRSSAQSQISEIDLDMQVLAMEVLRVLVAKEASRRQCNLVSGGTVNSICATLGALASLPSDGGVNSNRDRLIKLGFELLHLVLDDVESVGETPFVIQAPGTRAFLDAVIADNRFVRTLIATFMQKSGMKINKHDSQYDEETTYEIPSIYGPPLVASAGPCGEFQSLQDAMESFLFDLCAFATAIESRSDAFWTTALAHDLHQARGKQECTRASAAFAAQFLLSTTGDAPMLSLSHKKEESQEEYEALRGPLVRYRLLEALSETLRDTFDDYMLSVLIQFNVPRVCLSVWKDPALLDLSHSLLKFIIDAEPDEVLHLFVENKESLLALLDLLNMDLSPDLHPNANEIRRFLATLLESLAENGTLAEAVERFGVRGSAVSALAAACLSDDAPQMEDDEDLTSNRMSSGIMRSLVQLCVVPGGESGQLLELKPQEAESIALKLGKKISQMVITRFIERAKLQQYEIDDDENLMEAPDVAMLCAIAQHEKALQVLRKIGGFHALAQIAGEGNLLAMSALQKGCKDDPSLLLEADTYLSIISLFTHTQREGLIGPNVENTAFQLLSQLCLGSSKGKKLVVLAPGFDACLTRALVLISPSDSSGDAVDGDEEPPAEAEEDDEEQAEQVEEKSPESPEPPAPVVDENLVQAAFGFVASVSSVPSVQARLLDSESFVATMSLHATEGATLELKMSAILMVSHMASTSTPESLLSPEKACEILQAVVVKDSILEGNKDTASVPNTQVVAAKGLLSLVSRLSNKIQGELLGGMIKKYSKLLKERSLSKVGVSSLAIMGELAFTLSSTMLVLMGNEEVWGSVETASLLGLAGSAQWFFDAKTTFTDNEKRYWDATTTQSLQILAYHLCRGKCTSKEIRSMKENNWMVARAGKAPRKSISFPAALAQARDGTDALRGLSACNILRVFEASD